MAGFSLDIDLSEVINRLAFLESGMKDLTPAMKAFGEYMMAQTQARFSGEHDPEGRPWAKLSPRTYEAAFTRRGAKAKYTRKGTISSPFRLFILAKKILTTSGILRGSITYVADHNSLTEGTNMVYGRIQQLGGQAGRGHKVTIPARQYLGFNMADIAEAAASIKDQLGLAA